MSNSSQRLRDRIRAGFTLVEIMTVMVILAIMGGMIVTAVQGVTNSARLARTRTIIGACDAVVQKRFEEFRHRPFAVEIPDLFNEPETTGTNGIEVGWEVLATEAARVRLIMLRDLQRLEIPDRYSDFVTTPPAVIFAAASPVIQDSATGNIVGQRAFLAERKPFPVEWYSALNLPPKTEAYQDRTLGTANETNQGAECLYLIMATSFEAGSPAIDAIPSPNIGDTDDDGMLEILDGWGRPLHFVRWPAGLAAVDLQNSIAVDDLNGIDTTVPDEFDLFRSDFCHQVAYGDETSADPTFVTCSPLSTATDPAFNETRPYAMRPLILSAGSDGELGVATSPIDDAGIVQTAFNYNATALNWPVSAAWMGAENQGRGSLTGINYPDPYYRTFVNNNLAGVNLDPDARLPGQIINSDVAADNVSNYQLQADAGS